MDAEFAEAALRQSWEVHRQAFGPILEPAFVDDQQARILLISALNHISRNCEADPKWHTPGFLCRYTFLNEK